VEIPETHYAKTDDGLSIAYQTLGDGPTDIVLVTSVSGVDVMWEEPSLAHVLHRLARMGRLICFDARGFGGSDPVPLGALPTPEAWTEDLRAVLDAVGSTTANLVFNGPGAFVGMMFAATYPERTTALVLIQATARVLPAEDDPLGGPPDLIEMFVQWVERGFGTGANVAAFAPSRAGDEAFCRWFARSERVSLTPATWGAVMRWFVNLDMRSVLPSIRVPTLVIRREDDQLSSIDGAHYLVDHIPDARLVVVPGTDFFFFTQGADEIVDHIEEFITGAPPLREADRALATVLFTDIVGSTDHATRLGDKRWTDLLNRHDELVSRELERHRGRKVNPTGDGILATFDGPARAVRCAQAICSAVRPLGIEVRAGLHTGEVEHRGEDIGGIAVHIGQRVSALAGAGEVLVSRTVTDLVAGSGIEFEDRGEQELKGVPGKWSVYAVKT
jgi:class 3 adenylate cyclase/pimeloyl-ACP methyl ester carboxylesterase